MLYSNSRTKNATLNIIFALLLQMVNFFRGLILPRIIIPTYGSDLNGLISSITQFLAYISFLEAGVGSVFRASLYKPLVDGDMNCVSGIINEQKRFYRKIGLTFVLYVIILCIIYPRIAKTEIDKFFIVTCILILSISTFAEYFFSLPYISLLSADQKIRINYVVSIIYTLFNILVALFLGSMKADIRMIYLSMGIIGLLRPLFYTLYVKRHYVLNKSATCNKTALNQRWNGMVHHFAFYIHRNTDSTILTLFVSTAMVSVYGVYSSIISGVQGLILSISNSIAAGLGSLLAVDSKERSNQIVDFYELLQGGSTTVLFSVTAQLLIPFIRIYTKEMEDINYIHPMFGNIMIIAEAIYCFRCIYSTISTNANRFKETQLGAIIECILNFVISLFFVLVVKAGIVGVAIGTMVAMFSRYVFEVWYLSKNVLNRPVKKAIKMFMVSVFIAFLSENICSSIFDYTQIVTFGRWVMYLFATGFTVGIIAIIVYTIFYKDIVCTLCRKLFLRVI